MLRTTTAEGQFGVLPAGSAQKFHEIAGGNRLPEEAAGDGRGDAEPAAGESGSLML